MPGLDPEARQLLDRTSPANPVSVAALTPEVVRADELYVLPLQRVAGELHSIDDLFISTPAGTLPVRVYRPEPGPLHPLLYLHGGGFVIGGEGYESPMRELALASGCLVVVPECRLAPEFPFPAAVDDAAAVARWLRSEAPTLGASTSDFGVVGDSSGGNLAAVTTLELTRDGTPPSFQVLIYPMLDATASSPSYWEFADGYGFTAAKSRWYFDQYLPPGADRRSPRISPMFDSGGFQNAPRTLIVTAEFDPLRDEGERYAQRLREAGVPVDLRRYDGMIHGFFQLTGALEQSRRLHIELGEWIRQGASGWLRRDVQAPARRPTRTRGGCS